MKTSFVNQEQAFKDWIRQKGEKGYLLNCFKGAAGAVGWPIMLHRADCIKFTTPNRRSGKNFTTRKYYKVCSTNMAELLSWAKRERGEQVPKCKLCL
jgi:hypothetical protein